MGWAIFGLVLLFVYFWLFAIMFVGGDADARAIAEYERARDEFERFFE